MLVSVSAGEERKGRLITAGAGWSSRMAPSSPTIQRRLHCTRWSCNRAPTLTFTFPLHGPPSLLTQARLLYPNAPIACLASFGTGQFPPTVAPRPGSWSSTVQVPTAPPVPLPILSEPLLTHNLTVLLPPPSPSLSLSPSPCTLADARASSDAHRGGSSGPCRLSASPSQAAPATLTLAHGMPGACRPDASAGGALLPLQPEGATHESGRDLTTKAQGMRRSYPHSHLQT